MALPIQFSRNHLLFLPIVLLLQACGTVSELSDVTDYRVCVSAVTREETLFNWEKRESNLPYVEEAKRRGFELGDCIRMSRTIDSWSFDTSKIESDSNKSICTYAISKTADHTPYWRSWGNFWPFVIEAKKRGLSPDDCMEMRGWEKDSILEPDTIISDLPDRVICSLGTSTVGNRLEWDNHGRLKIYSDEAKRRGLSLGQCESQRRR